MHTSTSKIEIAASAEKVWAAITRPDMVKLWQYGSVLNTTWALETPIRFTTAWGDKVFEQCGSVISFLPNKMLKYSLFAPRQDLLDSPENYFFMSYVLEENAGKTILSIIQDDPRPQTEPATADDRAGNAILQGLKELVERG
jgi:hypothetical protein